MGMIKPNLAVAIVLALGVSACQKPYYSAAEIDAAHRDCLAEGFDPGTTEFEDCKSELLQDHAE